MAARGAQAKSAIIDKILNTFEGSFLMPDGKELRIPMVENGEQIQIKVGFTAAKENVENPAGSGNSGSTEATSISNIPEGGFEMTSEEITEVRDMIKVLDL